MLVAEVENDVAYLQQVIAEKDKRITELELEISNLRHQLDNLIRMQFGQRSERLVEEDDSDTDTANIPASEIEFESVGGYTRKKRQNRSERFPESLPRVNVYYDIDEKDKQCPCGCGVALRKMGEVVTQELVLIPETLYVRCHVRPKYGGCRFDLATLIRTRKVNYLRRKRGVQLWVSVKQHTTRQNLNSLQPNWQ